jgi:hypothetical protein
MQKDTEQSNIPLLAPRGIQPARLGNTSRDHVRMLEAVMHMSVWNDGVRPSEERVTGDSLR